jgi:hypothetical protein
MKVNHSAARITDEELQVCQKIWHEFDDDGNGVNVEGFQEIPEKMLKEGAILIAANGQVVPAEMQYHRKGRRTGLGIPEGTPPH